ncbi:MAG: hypothetical protein IJZ39_07175 [Oscillospiraceae bacterium]|nr:hypothetical protein [Oscillospiraceae bacterium]
MEMSKVTITANNKKKDLMHCLCCGNVFIPIKEMRYTARDNEPGKQLFAVATETKQYDAFDCPQCGCQIIAGERLRPVDEAVFALGDIDEVHKNDIPEAPGAIEVDE